MRHRSLTSSLAGLLLLLACPAASRADDAPVMIGMSEPLTGVNAFYGEQARQGAQLALDEVNAKGGVNGRKLAIDFQDNGCNPADGVRSVTQMLAARKYIAILDGGCSSVALAIMPLIARAEIPYVVANPSADSIAAAAGVGGNKWTFKVNPSDTGMLKALMAWLQKGGKTDRVAVLAEDTDYGRGGARALGELLGKDGKSLLSTDYFQKGTTDFSAAFARILAKKPSQLAIFTIGADSANFMNQWAEFGGGAPLTGRIQLEQIPREVVGSPAFAGLSTVQPWDASVDLPANKAFVAAFRKLANAEPTVNAWDAYEATRVLIAAIEAAGPNPTPAGVRDALETVKVPAMFGGTIDFDDHHLGHINAVVLTIQDGKVVVLGMSKT